MKRSAIRIFIYLLTTITLLTFFVPDANSAESDWLVLENPPLKVRYHEPTEAFARQVLSKSAIFLVEVAKVLRLPAQGPYIIVLAGSRDEFVRLQPTATPGPEWAGALTYPQLGVVLLMTPGALGTSGSGYWSLLQHEMVHLVVGEAEFQQGGRLPRWLSEGVATYIAGEMRLPRLLHLSWAQITGSAVPFEELERNFPENPALAEAAYAQSYLFVQFIMRKYGWDAVGKLVASVIRESNMNEAVFSAFGVSLAELMAGFQDYAKAKATWVPVITSSATVWGAITLLFLLTYVRKRVAGYRVLREWDLEDEQDSGHDLVEDNASEKKRPTVH